MSRAILGLLAVSLYPIQAYFIPKLQYRVNMMAKERVLSLEDQNFSLRQKLDERGGLVTMTRDKLAEAQQALQDTLLTEADFAAIKQKYMHENFGVVQGGVAPGASSAAQPEMT